MGVTYQDSNARMSQVAIHNGTVYLAGQVPLMPRRICVAKPSRCWRVSINC